MFLFSYLNELRPQSGQILLTLFKFLSSSEKGARQALLYLLSCLQLKATIFVQFKQV